MGPHVKLMSNPAVVVKIIVSLPPSWKSTIMYAVPIAKLWHELKCKSWISLCRCAFFEFSIWHARHYSFNRRIRKMCAMYIQLDCWSSGRTRKIYLARNQKGYDNSKTTVGKLLARRIQIWVVYFCLGNILKVILNNFQNNAQTKFDRSDSDSPHRIP